MVAIMSAHHWDTPTDTSQEMQICQINTIYIKLYKFFLSAIGCFVLHFLLFNVYSIILVLCVFP